MTRFLVPRPRGDYTTTSNTSTTIYKIVRVSEVLCCVLCGGVLYE